MATKVRADTVEVFFPKNDPLDELPDPRRRTVAKHVQFPENYFSSTPHVALSLQSISVRHQRRLKRPVTVAIKLLGATETGFRFNVKSGEKRHQLVESVTVQWLAIEP
jgi:hypothetical protein